MVDAVRTDLWMGHWRAMLDSRCPDWRASYDAPGFDLAVGDVFGGEPPLELGPGEADLLAEFTLREDEERAALCRTEGPFRRAAIEFEYIFRLSHGSSLDSDELRRLRAAALGNLVESALAPVARRLARMDHAREMREKRHARRHPRLPEPGLLRDRAGAGPEAAALAGEAAERTFRRASLEIAPRALGAVGRFLAHPGEGPACRAATAAGISPATMTRALRRLQEIAAAELEGCREAVEGPFLEALLERLRVGRA